MAEFIAGVAGQVVPVQAREAGGPLFVVSIGMTTTTEVATDHTVVNTVPGGYAPVAIKAINASAVGTFTVRVNGTAISASVAAAASESLDIPVLAAAYNVPVDKLAKVDLLWAGTVAPGEVVQGHVIFAAH